MVNCASCVCVFERVSVCGLCRNSYLLGDFFWKMLCCYFQVLTKKDNILSLKIQFGVMIKIRHILIVVSMCSPVKLKSLSLHLF